MKLNRPLDYQELADQITPEWAYLNRRKFMSGAVSGVLAAWGAQTWAQSDILSLTKNKEYLVDDADHKLTAEKLALSYNNFYEFSLDKDEVQKKVVNWKLSSWPIEITGLVEKPLKLDVDELIKKFSVEERVYRFRCVEAWSMVLPWAGIPLAKIVEWAKPKAEAKFIEFTSYSDANVLPNIKGLPQYPWPYTEGLRMDEATNPLALMVVGLYGKRLPKQNGAPIRLITPWKYGFKSIKSVVKVNFVAQQPKGLWEKLAPSEYGFYANVNPEVDHPRWSQKTERVVDGSWLPKRITTLKFNGYEKQVAALYAGLDLKKNY